MTHRLLEPKTVPAAARRPESDAAALAAGTWPDGRDAEPPMRFAARAALVLTASVWAFLWARVFAGTLVDCWNDDNYSHGILVPVLVAVLAFRRHHDVYSLDARARRNLQVLAWTALALGGAAFVLGAAAAEPFTQRMSGVLAAAGLVGILGGPVRLRRFGVPVLILGCMVPLPYVLYYKISFPLQLLSARFAADVMHLLGFDVARTGNVFEVNGHALEVVRACSGVRSMMALATLALVSAVWMRLRPAAAAALVLASLPAAVAGNLLRLLVTALLVVAVGPRVTKGWAHDAIGVASFVGSLALLGLVAAFLRRGSPPRPAPARPRWHSARRTLARARPWLGSLTAVSPRAAWAALAFLVAAGAYGRFLEAHIVAPTGTSNLGAMPLALPSLEGHDLAIEPRVLEQLRADDYVFRTYASATGPDVALYVGYYRDPRQGAQIHSPMHCYPGAGWKVRASEPLDVLDLRGEPTRMQRLVVQRQERRDVVVYWYETRTGRWTGDVALKLELMRAALLHRPHDAAFVRWSSPIADGESLEAATARLLAAVARAYPHLESALPFGG